MASDLVTLAWNNAGQPAPTTAATQTGECARCGAATDLVRVTQAVSKKFTSYGSWLNPRSRAGLCPACVWIYRTPELRSENHRLTPTTLTAPSKEDVHRELSAGVLACDVALVVPIRPGRKHLFEWAQFGEITTDNGQLSWTDADAARLRAATALVDDGFGSRSLHEPVPPWPRFRHIPSPDQAATLALWQELTPWRESPMWLTLAQRILPTHLETTTRKVPA